jgi:hypothetical protein
VKEMPKLISPDPPSFNPSSISSFSTSNGSKRPISIKKKIPNNNFKNLDKTKYNKDKLNEKNINESKLIKKNQTYSSSSSSFSSMSSSLNLEMSSSSATTISSSESSSSMYSSLNEKSIESQETNKYIKMVDRKFIGVLPRLSDTISKKSLSKLESSSEVSSSKKNGWKIKEKYKKSSKRNSLLKLDDIIERNHPAILENLKYFNYISASTVSSSSSSSFLSLSDAAIQKPFSNNIKSVALSYYHHLYEQKQKSINSNNLQPLYKFTYNNNNNNNNNNFKTVRRLSNYNDSLNYEFTYDYIQNESLNNSLSIKNTKIKKEISILNDQSLSRLEKNLPDCLIRQKNNGLSFDRLTKSTNNLDNEMAKSNLKIISKLNRNEFLDDKLNVKTVYKNISPNKRKYYSDPHNSIIRDTLDKLDDTKRKNWLTSKNNLSLSQFIFNYNFIILIIYLIF